jgi:hypothetical protein
LSVRGDGTAIVKRPVVTVRPQFRICICRRINIFFGYFGTPHCKLAIYGLNKAMMREHAASINAWHDDPPHDARSNKAVN